MADEYQDHMLELEAHKRLIEEGAKFVRAAKLFLEFNTATTLAGINERNSAILRMQQLLDSTALAKVVALEDIND